MIWRQGVVGGARESSWVDVMGAREPSWVDGMGDLESSFLMISDKTDEHF